MYQLGLINNFIPLIVPAIAAPAVIFFMKSYMKSSFPLDIVEASRIDGCGEYRTFLTIALPMMKPAIAVQAIFAFVANWNNYYTQNMILKNPNMATIPIMISKVLGLDRYYDYGVNYLCVVLSILPIIIIYFISPSSSSPALPSVVLRNKVERNTDSAKHQCPASKEAGRFFFSGAAPGKSPPSCRGLHV